MEGGDDIDDRTETEGTSTIATGPESILLSDGSSLQVISLPVDANISDFCQAIKTQVSSVVGQNTDEDDSAAVALSPSEEPPENEPVWFNPRYVSSRDRKATKALIDIYGSPYIQPMLKNHKIKTKSVFQEIASQLHERGFVIHENPNLAWERCHQKWRNLERAFKYYVIAQSDAGGSKKKRPEFFNELYSIILQKNNLTMETLHDETLCQPGTSRSTGEGFEECPSPSSPIVLESPNSSRQLEGSSHVDTDPEMSPTRHDQTPEAKRRRTADVIELLEECPQDETISKRLEEEPAENAPIWTKKAIKDLIALYGSLTIQRMVNDEHIKTKTVFQKIASQLQQKGYLIHEDPSIAWQRCHQKWRNMERSFKYYLISQTKPGVSKRKRPAYFADLFRILENKHKPPPVAVAENHTRSLPLLAPAGDHRSMTNTVELLEEYRQQDKRWQKQIEKKQAENFESLKTMLERQHQEKMSVLHELVDLLKKKTTPDAYSTDFRLGLFALVLIRMT